ncbi:MAG: hypothetical protein KAJ19_08015 [Gammaproteobacteria bacterium]|nr:hypothetical protein [Gammaproteobacteria bacterium]
MAYDAVKKQAGRKPIRFFDIQLTKCALTYGSAPCTASGSAGSECRNSRATCQDVANFDGSGTLTIRIIEETTEHLFGMGAIPCVTKINTASTELAPGEKSTGENGGLQIQCRDFSSTDRATGSNNGIDPYVANRSYTPEEQGTYFAKLKAIHPYWANAEVVENTGYLQNGYDAANFKQRTYYLEKFTGPNKAGTISFVAQSIMRRMDDDRVTCPEITTGTLTAALDAGTTTNFTVSGDEDLYDTSNGSVRINDEAIEYTTGLDNGDGTFTFSTLTRGVDNTTAAAHDSDDVAQKCVLFSSQTARQIAYSLYVTYGGIPAANIDTTQWDVVADLWLQETYSRRVTEPTGIKELLSEVHEEMGFFTWWDAEAGKVYLEAIRAPDSGISTYTEGTHIIAGSVEIEELPDKRITQAHVYFNPRTSIEGSKPHHFKGAHKTIDVGAESSDQYGGPKIKSTLARWLISNVQAAVVSDRRVDRFRNGLRLIKFQMDAKDEVLKTGDQAYIEVDAMQDADGSQGTILIQVMQRDDIKTGETYAYRAWPLSYEGTFFYFTPDAAPDYSSASDSEKADYGYFSDDAGKYSDGVNGDKFI